MGNSRQNNDAEAARKAQAQADADYRAAIVKSQEKTPIQLAQEKSWLNDEGWFNNPNGPDYSAGGSFKTADGQVIHAPKLIYADAATQGARARREDDRAGTGLFQLGSQGNNAQLGQALKEQRTRRFADQAGQDYVGAVSRARAEHEGSALPLMNFGLNQTGQGLNAYGNRLGNATQRVGMSPWSASPWPGIAAAGIGGAASLIKPFSI